MSDAAPSITGILIFLNGERYLAEAIDSVVAQTFVDWELLLCDDGSTDGATAIAKDYAARYPGKIRYLEHPNHENRGMSATRNLGIRNARGRYIAMLDADDIWVPVKLQEQYDILQAHPEAAMVYGPMKLWYSWTGRPQDDRRDTLQPMGVTPDSVVQAPELLLSFLRNPSYHVCGLLTRKDVLEAVGGYAEEFRTEYEDVVVQSKISLEYPVYASGKCWYWYRQHDESCTAETRRNWQQRPARLKYLNKFEQHLKTKGITSGPVWAEVQKQLRPFRQKTRYRIENLVRSAGLTARSLAKAALPAPLMAWARSKWWHQEYTPPTGWVRFGSLRRTRPVSRDFGCERGTPIDRYYIEKFLADNAQQIRGRVLEFGDNRYTTRFGGSRVTRSDVMNPVAGIADTTILGDLQHEHSLPAGQFDCILLTHVLPCVYDTKAALRNCVKSLRPGGVILATLPCISQISWFDQVRWGDYWRFTSRSAGMLFEESLAAEQLSIHSHGNALAATALLQGIASEELTPAELDVHDDEYEIVITVRAQVPAAVTQRKSAPAEQAVTV